MTTFRTYLKIFLSHRVYIAIYLVMLSMVGVMIGLSTGSAATGEYQPTSVRVAVIDRDNSQLSRALASRAYEGNERVGVADQTRAIQDAVARDMVTYLLVIPKGWGEGLLEAAAQGASAPDLQSYVSYSSGSGELVDIEITNYADGLYGMAATLGGAGADGSDVAGSAGSMPGSTDAASTTHAVADADDVIAATDAAWKESAQVGMIEQVASPLPNGLVVAAQFATYSIFSSAMVCIAVLMTSVGRKPVRDRRLASPESARARNLALLGACATIALIAWAWNFALEVAVLGGSALTTSPVQLALVGAALLVYALVSAGAGFLVGQLGASENAANAIANILGMVMSFLGGAWTGLSLLPDELLAVAHFTPAYWVTLVVDGAAGMGEVSTANVMPLLGNLGICALFGVAAVLVGMALRRSATAPARSGQ